MAGNSKDTDVDKICEHLFEEVKRVYTKDKKLPYDLLSVLQFLFQAPLLPALELVEKEAVSRIVSQSSRELFQWADHLLALMPSKSASVMVTDNWIRKKRKIVGTSGTPYICFPNLKYCTCPAYHYSVLIQEEYIMCKHVLAMRLAVSMGMCKQMDLSDEEMSKMIQDMN